MKWNWRCNQSGTQAIVFDDEGETVFRSPVGKAGNIEEHIANAKLATAAHDLLEACKEMLPIVQGAAQLSADLHEGRAHKFQEEAILKAMSAIMKAEGND